MPRRKSGAPFHGTNMRPFCNLKLDNNSKCLDNVCTYFDSRKCLGGTLNILEKRRVK